MQMNHNETHARRAELFEALSRFERTTKDPKTMEAVRDFRAALIREESNEGYVQSRRRVVYYGSEGDEGNPSAEGLSTDHQRVGVLLRPRVLRAA